MEQLVVYTTQSSPRLKYVLDWLIRERLQLDYIVITDARQAANHANVLAYGTNLPGSVAIPDSGLLWQTGITQQDPATGTWKDIPTLFAAADGRCSLTFDMFSAIFYLLSRYEEYYSYTPDKHDRYPPACSILYKKGWLQRPLADEWVDALRRHMQAAFKITIAPTTYLHQPTYDIDMAYSHLHKGLGRIVGAYLRAILKIDIKQISERTQVLKNKQKDPYDSFRWLRQLHKEYGCKPLYFVLSAASTTRYDKNIHPTHPAMVRVIKNLAREGVVGIHPSYYSAQGDVMAQEKQALAQIAGTDMLISRQHYIRVTAPGTYRMLLQNGIKEDYTMGYGSRLGFRAGTGNSFYWYDLEQETISALRIHPFCFMDTTAMYEGGMTVSEAFAALENMSKILEQTGSTLITIFHNFSLGTSNEWKGWRQAYEHFLQEKHTKLQQLERSNADSM